MAADRIRVGEADVMIAGGSESMSMVPMGGIRRRSMRESSRRTKTSASRTLGLTRRRLQRSGKSRARCRISLRLRVAQKASRTESRALCFEMTTIDIVEKFPHLAPLTSGSQTSVNLDEGPRADTNLQVLASCVRVCGERQRHGGQQLATSDGAGA